MTCVIVLRSVIDQQKIAGNKSGGSGKAKRPAWDMKGRLADMESLFEKSNKRIMDLESENHALQSDVDMKLEVVAGLERKLKSLEDELASKQTEISGMKQSVAELVSSSAGMEANLAGVKLELETVMKQNSCLKAECEEKMVIINEGLEEREKLNMKLIWEESERRKLHNTVQELKGNIRVFCR